MSDHSFSYIYQFESRISPKKLWPLLSDTNRLFKDIGEHPIQRANLSHSVNDGFKELTYEQIHRPDVWIEEPYQWEAPYYLSVRRKYKTGYFESMNIAINLIEMDHGSKISIRFFGKSTGLGGWLVTKKKFNTRLKHRIKKVIRSYELSVLNEVLPRQQKKSIKLQNPVRWKALKERLTTISEKPQIVEKLILTLQTADDEDLKNLSPIKLSSVWKEPLSDVLKVMFYAAKIDVLNFSWNVLCPHCMQTVQNCRSLIEITDPLYCKVCNKDFEVDFNRSVQLTFHPHPLIRKLQKKKYCIGSPSLHKHVPLHAILQPGQKRFVKIGLKEGNYRFSCDKTSGYVNAKVQQTGLENTTLVFSQDDLEKQNVILSPNTNVILHNQTEEPITIKCESLDWEMFSVSASEVTSWSLFRDLFPRELIRDKKKLAATDLTILFTDLFNSSQIYSSKGDDSAVGLVINHFDILQQIILEERGSIVKTIGDAVMAVFPKPIYAVMAFNRAQDVFKNELRTEQPIQLKGGVHVGNCVAVTLNNRIDYFGNTINIASRLVDYAHGEEIVISNDAYSSCVELKEFLATRRENLKIHHFDASLKGFENQTFEAKRITMQTSPLRLVV